MADAFAVRNAAAKVPKYRASCDACNEAKVRCSQTRPSCARCIKHNNRRCIYGISKRSGKHSAERSTKNGSVTRPTPTSTPTARTESPSSSPSTIDPRELLQPFNMPTAQGRIVPSLVKVEQINKDWTFHNIFAMPNESPISQGLPVNYYTMLGGDGSGTSGLHHVPGVYDAKLEDPFNTELEPYKPDESISGQDSFYKHSNPPCLSCSSTDRENNVSQLSNSCRCSETIVTQLSLLPVLLHNEICTFDVELLQFQQAIKLAVGVLDCTCAGKDYTSVLTIAMLIARIIAFFERRNAQGGHGGNNTPSIDMACNMTTIRSPKFCVGVYQIEGEDEHNLKQEVWWLQIKKVETLISKFKDMVTRMTRQQGYQDAVQAAAWEKLGLMLDHKAQMVKRDWGVSRDRG
ncbi:MAG: hypothetical protein Q9163_000817 [Psora crenata]